MKLKKGIVISDFHHPYEDKKIVKLYAKFIEAFRPDEVIINGDFLNYAAYNRRGHKKQIDHIDDNPLNNHINNLRLVTASQNSTKRSSLKNKSSKYPNVNAYRDNKWEMSIMRDRKRYRKNGFLTETEAFLYRQKLLLTIGEPIF